MNITHFIDSIPGGYSANAPREIQLAKKLPSGFVVRELAFAIDFNAKNNAPAGAAFALTVGDHNTLLAAFCARLRFSLMGKRENIILTPAEARLYYYQCTKRDAAVLDPTFRVASNVAANAAATTHRLWIRFPFWHRQLNDDNAWCPSSDQLALNNQTAVFECGATASGGTVALINGTALVNITDVKLFAEMAPAAHEDGKPYVPHVGNAHEVKQRTVTSQRDVVEAPHLPVFVADERSPATVDVQVSDVSIDIDGRRMTEKAAPSALAQCFVGSQVPEPALPSTVDVTSHSLGGIVLTPLLWLGQDATEYEWKPAERGRVINFTLASGGSAAATHLDARILPIDDEGTQNQMRELIAARGLSVDSLDQLAVRGGGAPGNTKNKRFKGRYIARTA